jgi:molybdopterin molybdotransferase
LLALVERAGGVPLALGIGRDQRERLREKIVEGLSADILVLSGGVSAGVLDLAPGVLNDVGVRQIFHKIQLKPGKPLWFGVVESKDAKKLVFGLPGNPVSSLVCFELFVRPAIARLAGRCLGRAPPICAPCLRPTPCFIFPPEIEFSGLTSA